jgi:type III restriction enzyme
MMKLKFDPSLAYQSDAVNAVSDVFVGQPIGQAAFEISSTLPSGVEFTELGVGNHLVLDDAQFLTNVRAVQERNGIVSSPSKWRRVQGRLMCISARSSS